MRIPAEVKEALNKIHAFLTSLERIKPRPNRRKDAERRKSIREWFKRWSKTWVCEHCQGKDGAAHYDAKTGEVIDLQRKAWFGTSPTTIRREAGKGVCLCSKCKP